MKSNKNEIVVVIPSFNEGIILRNVIQNLLNNDYENIIVIDDGSLNPVHDFIDDLPIILLCHRVNLGQGAALQTGFEYARKLGAEIVITFDADGQHDATDIPSLIDPILNNQADIVLGSRFLPTSSHGMPSRKRFLLFMARFVNFLFTGLLLSDAHNGLRALNRLALEKIVITENRMAHATEILYEIKKNQLRYIEVPVNIHYTEYSKQKGQSSLDSIKILFDLVLHKFFK